MHARISALLVVLFVTAPAFAGGFQRSANFDVFTPSMSDTPTTQRYAQTLLDRAEQYRREVAETWLGQQLPPSVGRTTINVSFSDRDYGLTWAKDNENRKYHTLYLSTTPNQALNHTLAHEMVHVVLATQYPHPRRLPAWLEEGIASRYDDPNRQQTRDQIVAWWAKTGNWPSFGLVLSADNISGDDQTAYAAAASITDYLLTRADKKTLLAFGDACRDDMDRALRAHYSIDDVSTLQQLWQTWVRGSQTRTAAQTTSTQTTLR